MTTLANLHQAIMASPGDPLAWRVLGDWLEEQGQDDRAELTRLTLNLRTERWTPKVRQWQDWVLELLAAGVVPCVPELVNSIGMRLALIPPGTFCMGTLQSEDQCDHREEWPPHEVEITKAFFLGVFPVTQEQYQQVTGQQPSRYSAVGGLGDSVVGMDTRTFPVENVSWNEAIDFCRRLSGLPEEKKARRKYRLPTEAEWEYACRASTFGATHFGDDLGEKQANFMCQAPLGKAKPSYGYLNRTCTVGSYPPNAWGLYDMHGNVLEWCKDWYGRDYYDRSPPRNPPGSRRGKQRVQRGGSWVHAGDDCQAARRHRGFPNRKWEDTGFRVACDVSKGT
jgi:uncharacterized protein (TIGR02996 family)